MKIKKVDPNEMVGDFKECDPVYRVLIMTPHQITGYSYFQDEYEISGSESITEVIEWCSKQSTFYKIMLDLGSEMEGTKTGRLFDLIYRPPGE